jgi:hypothetical protein
MVEGSGMTEAEWLACTDPELMLEFVRGNASNRKGHSKNYVQGAAAAKLFQPPSSTNSWKSFLEWPKAPAIYLCLLPPYLELASRQAKPEGCGVQRTVCRWADRQGAIVNCTKRGRRGMAAKSLEIPMATSR